MNEQEGLQLSYDIAVENGFEGSLEDYIESLNDSKNLEKAFNQAKKEAFPDDMEAFVNGLGLGKTKGVAAEDATVAPTPEASEIMGSGLEGISSELQYDKFQNSTKVTLEQENKIFDKADKFVNTGQKKTVMAKSGKDANENPYLVNEDGSINKELFDLFEEYKDLEFGSAELREFNSSLNSKLKESDTYINPTIARKSLNSAKNWYQKEKEIVDNKEWIALEQEAISRVVKDKGIKRSELNNNRATYENDVKSKMLDLYTEKLNDDQIKENISNWIQTQEDDESFVKKAADLLGSLSKYGGDFKTQEQKDITKIQKEKFDKIDSKVKSDIKFLNTSPDLIDEQIIELENIAKGNYQTQEEVDEANKKIVQLQKSIKTTTKLYNEKIKNLDSLLEKREDYGLVLSSLERDYNFIPILTSNMALGGATALSAGAELANAALSISAEFGLGTKFKGTSNVFTPVFELAENLVYSESYKNTLEQSRNTLNSFKEQISSGIAEPQKLDDLKDGDDWGRYFATLLGSQTLNTVVLFSTGGAALPILASQAAGSSFGEMEEEERQSRLAIERWENSDPNTRGPKPEVVDYTPAQKYITGIGNGALEYFTERISLGIINRSKAAFRAMPNVKNSFSESIGNLLTKKGAKKAIEGTALFAYDAAKEAGQEGLVELGSNMFDRYVLGKDINLFEGVKDAAFSGLVMGAGVYKAPQFFGSISTLVQKPGDTQVIGQAKERLLEIEKIIKENPNMDAQIRASLVTEHQQQTQKISNVINKGLNNFKEFSREDINELGNIEQKQYALMKEADAIEQDSGITTDKQALLNQVNFKKIQLDKQRVDILEKYGEFETDLSEEQVQLNYREIERQTDLIEGIAGKDAVQSLDNDQYLETLKKTSSKEQFEKSKNSFGYFDDSGVLYINKERAAKQGMVNTPMHEFLHYIMSNALTEVVGGKKQITDKAYKIIEDFKVVLKEHDPKAYAKVEKRIKKDYDPNTDSKDIAEEWLSTFAEVDYNQTLGSKLNNLKSRFIDANFKDEGFENLDFRDGKDLFDFLVEYKTDFKKGKIGDKAKKAVSEFKSAKQIVEDAVEELRLIDETESNFTQPEKTRESNKKRKEALQKITQINENFEEDVKKFSKNKEASERVQEIYDTKGTSEEAIFEIIEEFKPITAKIVSSKRDAEGFETFKDQLQGAIEFDLINQKTGKDRSLRGLILDYDPSKGVPLAAYINRFLPDRAIEAVRQILPEYYSDDVEKARGITSTEDNVSIEESVDESIKPTEQEELSLRKKIKLSDEQVEKVRQAVRKTFGTRLPSLQSPQFKKALRKAYDTELFKELKTNVFKARKDYEFFMSQNWKALYDAIPQETLNQSFAPFREPVLDETGKQKREKTPEGERIFRKKNITKEEFLDYFFSPDLGVSTRGTRKDAIVRMAAQELGFDATMETIQEPKVAEKIEFINPTVDVPNTAAILNRFPDKKFSANKTYEQIINEVKEITKPFYINPENEKKFIGGKANVNIKKEVIKNLIPVLKDLGKNLDKESKKYYDDVKYLLIYSLTGTGSLSEEAINRIKKETGLPKKEIQKFGRAAMIFSKVGLAEKALGLTKGQIKKVLNTTEGKPTETRQALNFAGKKLLSTQKIEDKVLDELFKNPELQDIVVQENEAKENAFYKIIKSLAEVVAENSDLLPEVLHLISLQAYYQGHFIRKLMPFVSFTKPYGKNFKKHDEHFTKAVDTSIYAQYMIVQAAKNGEKYIENKFEDDYKKLWSGSGRGVVTKESGDNFDLDKKPGQTEDINVSPFINVLEKLNEEEKKHHYLLPGTEFNKTDKLVNISEINKDGFYEEVEIPKEEANNLNKEINNILENKTSIAASETISEARARIAGAKSQKPRFFIPPSADDFAGLMYYMLGKGKKGEEQMRWMQTYLFDPYAKAEAKVSTERIKVGRKYNQLLKEFDIIPSTLKKEVPGGIYTQEQAVRVYIWDSIKQTIPGLSESEQKSLVDYVNSNKDLKRFADKVKSVSFGYGYSKPGKAWTSGTISTDFLEVINTTKRAAFLEQWQKNVDVIFSENNLNKMQAAFGTSYRVAVENALNRMRTGRNAQYTADSNTARFMDWVNGSIGAIMFFNDKSAVLQLLSTINFINWSDNNIFNAGKAFANQPQYWSDFKMLFNSDFLLNRREGLKMNVNEADLADAARTNGARGVISRLLKVGFLPTKLADSFAIASGGATFYRNRVNSLIKQGVGKDAAEKQAFQDFRETAENSQQSSRPDKISQQQASAVGRSILNFVNVNMQYNRVAKKAVLDLYNRRGDDKTNISKIVYYMAVQNLIFNALQQGLFAVLFGDVDEDEKKKNRYFRVANGMADTFLRGLGIAGGVFSVVKNIAIKIYEEQEKNNPKYEKIALEAVKISPPVSSKIQRLTSAGRTFSWNRKEIRQKGLALDSPAILGVSQVISAVTNIPADRVVKKVSNVASATTEDLRFYQRLALLLGWSKWDLGIDGKKKKVYTNPKIRGTAKPIKSYAKPLEYAKPTK
jgi:hypothetical protein